MSYYIPSNSSNPTKTYTIIEAEKLFIDSLLGKSNTLNGVYSLLRLSDGTINVDYNGYPIGKIKLQGKKTRMLVMKNLYDSKLIEGNIEDYIDSIDHWIKYIKKYLSS